MRISSKDGQSWEALLKQMRLVFYSAHLHRCAPDWANAPRVTQDEMLHILHRGEVCFEIGEKSFVAKPGQLIFCPPGIEWQARRVSEELVHLTVIHFNADFPGARRYLEVLGYPHFFTPPSFAAIESLGRKLCKAAASLDEGRSLKTQALMYELFYEIFNCRGAAALMDGDGKQVLDILEWMQSHFREPVTRETLSRRFYLSPQHLATIFRRHSGSSPIEYIIQLRLDEARRLLASTELSVQQISRSVGYEDPAYFSRLFKKSTGVSPNQFREEQAQFVGG